MDLLVIGGITFDYLFWVNRLPEKHFEGIIKTHGRFFGGRAPNVAVAAAKLGIKTGLVSCVGEDYSLEGYEDYLKAIGVDLRGIVKVPKKNTKQIFIFTDPMGSQITFFDYGAEWHFRKMSLPGDLMKESRIIHISSSGDYRFNLRCAKFARMNDVLVSFDPGNDPFADIPKYIRAMMKNCDLLFMNDIEASNILKRLSIDSASELLDIGPAIIVIINKHDKSSVVYTKDYETRIPTAVHKIKDPTGGSDGYIAAFLAGYIKGFDVKTSAKMGAIEASFVMEDLGAQTNLPDWNRLLKRYKTVFE